MAKQKPQKKKQRITVSKAIVHIKATFNNTIITFSDRNGNTLCWGSGGTVGYKIVSADGDDKPPSAPHPTAQTDTVVEEPFPDPAARRGRNRE